MGKGDTRRPAAVPRTTVQSNWDRVFGGDTETYEFPDVRCSDSPLAREESPAGDAYRLGWDNAAQGQIGAELPLSVMRAYDAGWRDYHKCKQYAAEET